MTTAKGLGNGFPVGACMTSGIANDIFRYGSHGSTYGGTPLACRVVSEVIDVIQQENLMDNVNQNSELLIQLLMDSLASDGVTVRGKGMMLGVVLPTDRNIDFSKLVDIARDEHQLIINVAGGNAIRLLPPLNMKTSEIEDLAARLIKLITSHLVQFYEILLSSCPGLSWGFFNKIFEISLCLFTFLVIKIRTPMLSYRPLP